MHVRDEDDVGAVQERRWWGRHDPPEWPDALAGGRVGQDRQAVELDERRGMPEELDADRHPSPLDRPAVGQRQLLRAASG